MYRFPTANSFFISLIFLFISTTISAQDYKIKWGPVHEKEGGLFAMFRLLGFDDDLYYIHSTPRQKEKLISYNLEHKEVNNIDILESVGRDDLSFRYILQTSGNRKAYFFNHDKDLNRWKIFSSDFKEGHFSPVKEIFNKEYSRKLNNISLFAQSNAHNAFGTSNNTGFKTIAEYAISNDQSKIAFITRFNTTAKDNKFLVGIAVFDDQMKLLWDKTQEFDYFDSESHLLQFAVTNEGKVFFAFNSKDREQKPGEKSKPERIVSLIRMNKDNFEEIPFVFDADHAPDDFRLFLTKNEGGAFIIAGFYSRLDKKRSLEGMFICKGAGETKKIIPTLYNFSDTLLVKLMTEKDVEKDKGLSNNFFVDHIVHFDNGGFAIIAEKRYITTYLRTSGSGSMKTVVNYHSDEILIPIFNSSGELVSIPMLEKGFWTRSRGSESYAFAFNQDKMYFVYSDFKVREERKELKEEGIKANIYSDLSVFNSKGQLQSQKTLFTNKDYDLFLVPSLSAFGNNQLLIGSMTPNKFSFGNINLE